MMRGIKRYFLVSIAYFLSSAFCYADHFRILEQRELPNHIGIYYHSQIVSVRDLSRVDFYVVKLNNNYNARFYLQPVPSQSQAKLMGNLDAKFVLTINGGFYSPEFQPVGLMVDQGKQLKRFKKNRLLTSCVTINHQGKMSLIPHCNESPNAFYAMQTGPVIIDHGSVTDDMNALQKRSKTPLSFFNPHPRTLLAEASDKSLLVIVTSPITLLQERDLLKNNLEALGIKKIESAVNLDGGASTGMYIRFKDSPVYIQEKMPVKVLVFFG